MVFLSFFTSISISRQIPHMNSNISMNHGRAHRNLPKFQEGQTDKRTDRRIRRTHKQLDERRDGQQTDEPTNERYDGRRDRRTEIICFFFNRDRDVRSVPDGYSWSTTEFGERMNMEELLSVGPHGEETILKRPETTFFVGNFN